MAELKIIRDINDQIKQTESIIITMEVLSVTCRDPNNSTKDRVSRNTSVSWSEESAASTSPEKSITLPLWHDFRKDLFQQQVECEVSQKVHQRAVSWMITICWSKNFSQECLWTTLQLYYCYRAKCKLTKEELELTLLTCLSLALKVSTIRLYSTKELAALSSRSITAADIVEREAVILDLIDFNIIIPHQLQQLKLEERLDPEDFEMVMMLAELMLVRNSCVFYSEELLEALLDLFLAKRGAAVGCERSQEMERVQAELKNLFQLKECKIILNKYSSRLEVERLQTLFQ